MIAILLIVGVVLFVGGYIGVITEEGRLFARDWVTHAYEAMIHIGALSIFAGLLNVAYSLPSAWWGGAMFVLVTQGFVWWAWATYESITKPSAYDKAMTAMMNSVPQSQRMGNTPDVPANQRWH